MSQYYAAYYGSGLKLSEDEFQDFTAKYLEVNNLTLEEFVKSVMGPDYEFNDAEEEFDSLIQGNAAEFVRSADIHKAHDERSVFGSVWISPDFADGMRFETYRTKTGKPNKTFLDWKRQIWNPDHISAESLRDDVSYMFYSDKSFDGPSVFDERPYNSYEEFVQEFKDKLEAYLPAAFDWDAHIGRFNYAANA